MSLSPVANLQPQIRADILERSLGISFALALAGNVFYAAAQWGMVVALARLGNPATVGQFALGLAITSPILTLTNLQLRTVLATDVSGRFRIGHCLALRLVGTSAFLVMIAIAGVAGGYERTTAVVLGAVAVMKAAESLSDIGYGVLQSRERMDRIALSQILKAGVSLTLMVGVIAITGSCLAGILALSAGFVVTLATFDFAAVSAETGRKEWIPVWEWTRLGELFRLSLPLGFTLLLVALNANIPRYVLEHQRGVREVGVFSAIAYVAVSGNLLVMALGQAVAPRMAKAYESDLNRFRRLSTRLFVVAAAVGTAGLCAAIMAGTTILALLYGDDYATEQRLFVWLMISGILSLSASAAGFTLTSARYFRVQIPVLLLVCVVSSVACLALVPDLGPTGAAIGQACGSAVQLCCSLGYLLMVLRRGVPASGSLRAAMEMFFKREV